MNMYKKAKREKQAQQAQQQRAQAQCGADDRTVPACLLVGPAHEVRQYSDLLGCGRPVLHRRSGLLGLGSGLLCGRRCGALLHRCAMAGYALGTQVQRLFQIGDERQGRAGWRGRCW